MKQCCKLFFFLLGNSSPGFSSQNSLERDLVKSINIILIVFYIWGWEKKSELKSGKKSKEKEKKERERDREKERKKQKERYFSLSCSKDESIGSSIIKMEYKSEKRKTRFLMKDEQNTNLLVWLLSKMQAADIPTQVTCHSLLLLVICCCCCFCCYCGYCCWCWSQKLNV